VDALKICSKTGKWAKPARRENIFGSVALSDSIIMIPPQDLSKGHKFKVSGEAQFKGKA
jgi:hypothetical protein